MGGRNVHWNIVKLTFREHFLAHWLLTKFVADDFLFKMNNALMRMCKGKNGDIRTSWQYEIARRLFSAINKGKKHSEETRNKMALAHSKRDRRMTEEVKRKMALAKIGNKAWLGRKHTEETKRKLSLLNMGKSVGRKHTEETKRKMSLKHKGRKYTLGRKLSDKTRQKMKAGQQQRRSNEWVVRALELQKQQCGFRLGLG